ncbi:hypothetical protein ABZ599_37765 [Streptomyces misionensis]|uniref:hypothetical protein n=1 Tax=Streptomyces misionensis TaxID=67331 RepID=UPI0033F8434B
MSDRGQLGRGHRILRGAYDETFDNTDLPAEPILTSYVSVRDEKIVSLVITLTRPADH